MTQTDRVERKSKPRCATEEDVIELLRIGRRLEQLRVVKIVSKVKSNELYGDSYTDACNKVLAALRKGTR